MIDFGKAMLNPMFPAAHIEHVGDPTEAWEPELSYLTFGISAEYARRLGSLFRQDAVVWAGEDAIPQLLLLR